MKCFVEHIASKAILKNITNCEEKYKKYTKGNFTKLIIVNNKYIKLLKTLQTLKFSPVEHIMMHQELEKAKWASERLQSKYDEIQEFDSIEMN
jgi:predicted methyltransferase